MKIQNRIFLSLHRIWRTPDFFQAALQACAQAWTYLGTRTLAYSLLLSCHLFLWIGADSPQAYAMDSQEPPTFSFHLYTEPANLDPHLLKSSSSNYLIQNLYRNLFWVGPDGSLVEDLAKSCHSSKKNTQFTCEIRPQALWSDGTEITSEDFKYSFERILKKETKAPKADFLFGISGAVDFFEKKKSSLTGVKILSPKKFVIQLSASDSDFLYRLASPLTAPVKLGTEKINPLNAVVSGPYKIKSWEPGKKISLESQNFYWKPGPRPPIVVQIIQEDSVALNLYEVGQLEFLRRLPTLFIPKYSSRPDYHALEVIRFDYLGLTGTLKDNLALRTALIESLNYPELRNIFSAKGDPGCFGLPKTWYQRELCFSAKIKGKTSTQESASPSELATLANGLNLIYSTQGGEDHKRAMEWMQSQWQLHLGLQVHIRAVENKIFLEEIKKNPDLFRKGLSPDIPTCASVLEDFTTGAAENYIHFKNKNFDTLVAKLKNESQPLKRRALCQKALEQLFESKMMIPLGPMYFSLLYKSRWLGIHLNPLNQLDLSELRLAPAQ